MKFLNMIFVIEKSRCFTTRIFNICFVIILHLFLFNSINNYYCINTEKQIVEFNNYGPFSNQLMVKTLWSKPSQIVLNFSLFFFVLVVCINIIQNMIISIFACCETLSDLSLSSSSY